MHVCFTFLFLPIKAEASDYAFQSWVLTWLGGADGSNPGHLDDITAPPRCSNPERQEQPVLPTWPPPFLLCRAGPTMNLYTQASATAEDVSAYYRSNTMATGQAPKYQAF